MKTTTTTTTTTAPAEIPELMLFDGPSAQTLGPPANYKKIPVWKPKKPSFQMGVPGKVTITEWVRMDHVDDQFCNSSTPALESQTTVPSNKKRSRGYW
jgi:hypothetical protein